MLFAKIAISMRRCPCIRSLKCHVKSVMTLRQRQHSRSLLVLGVHVVFGAFGLLVKTFQKREIFRALSRCRIPRSSRRWDEKRDH